MTVPNENPQDSSEELSFGDLLEQHLQAKKAGEGEAPAAPADDAAPKEVTEQPKETPAPESKKRSWKDLANEELPEDAPHGFLAGKPISQAFSVLKDTESQMHKANERANRAEAIAAANEVLVQTLSDQLKKQTARPSPPPPRDVFEEDGVDLQNDIVLNPSKVVDALDKKQQRALEQQRQDILSEIDKRLEAEQLKKEQAEVAIAMAQTAERSAVQALTELNIPKQHWRQVLDALVPILNDPSHEYRAKGGVMEVANYKKVVEDNPIIKRAIISIATPDVPVVPPAPVPPGAKAPSVTAKPERPQIRISDSTRQLWEQNAKLAGCTTPAEIEEFVAQCFDKKNSYRTARREK